MMYLDMGNFIGNTKKKLDIISSEVWLPPIFIIGEDGSSALPLASLRYL